MQNIMVSIRNKYHPLFHLRKFAIFQKVTQYLDIPVSIRFPSIQNRLYVSLSKNLSFVLSGGAAGEEKERLNFAKIVSLGRFKAFFDVGANVGIYGFLFKTLVPQGSVVMFEPDPSNVRLLKLTIEKYHIENIDLVEAAVSDTEGTISFYKDDVSGSTGAIQGKKQGKDEEEAFVQRHHGIIPNSIIVKTVSLDGISSLKIDPDFIKIDVEGAEMSVFNGALSLIKRASPAIFFECDSHEVNIINVLLHEDYILYDFETLSRSNVLCHNNLALNKSKHKDIITALG